MKLRNLLAGALVVGLGAAAGPAAAQPETAESMDLERLQAQTLEVADIRFVPMCKFPPVRTVASNNFLQPGPFGEREPCWHPMFGPAPLLG